MGSVALSSAGIGGVKHSNISWVGGRPYEWPAFSSSPLGLLLFSLSLGLSLSACLILLILQRCPHTKSSLSNLTPLVLSQESLKGALQINEERLRLTNDARPTIYLCRGNMEVPKFRAEAEKFWKKSVCLQSLVNKRSVDTKLKKHKKQLFGILKLKIALTSKRVA